MQLDIIMRLYIAGAPTTLEDESGDSASDRACRRLEEPFLEGAMLLGMCCPLVGVLSLWGTHDNIPNSPPDILSILESKRTSSTARVETPGKVRMWVKPYSGGWGVPLGISPTRYQAIA